MDSTLMAKLLQNERSISVSGKLLKTQQYFSTNAELLEV